MACIAIMSEGSPTRDVINLSTDLRNRTIHGCPGCSLKEALTLHNIVLSDADFNKANFVQGNFSGTQFDRSNVSNVKATLGNFSDASFIDADLSNTDFTNAKLMRANLIGANITGTIFTNANLSEALWIDGRTCAKNSIGKCND